MAPVKQKFKHLPLRMTQRSYKNKQGKVWIGYYYEMPRDENGKKKVIPLGSDLTVAMRKWAVIEGNPSLGEYSLNRLHEEYMEWAKDSEKSELSLRTLKDRLAYWKNLSPAFGHFSPDEVLPEQMLPYFHERSSQSSAKKELKYLSVLFNWGRARGKVKALNPVTGLTRQMKVKECRDIYVSDSDLELVYKHASDVVKDALDIAYLTGQRPADVLKMQWDHIKDGVLEVRQNKTKKLVRIAIVGELAHVFKKIRSRPVVGLTILIDPKGNPLNQFGHFRKQFDKARNKAEIEAEEKGIEFTRFQFRDLRAKAASDLEEENAQALLGHTDRRMTSRYRRKTPVTIPVMSKSLLDMENNKSTNNEVSC